MATVQSIINRVTYITGDYDRARWSLAELVTWLNEAAALIAEAPGSRASSQYLVLTLGEGSRQDLREIDNSKRWIRLLELVCNAPDGSPTGRTIRQIARPALDAVQPTWRGRPAVARTVEEYALDERNAFMFDVVPPVADGVQVYALAAVKPGEFGALNGQNTALADASEKFPLADGLDTPAVDYVLYRCFSKDANAPSYAARAAGHSQAFQAATGLEIRDTAQ